MLLKGAYCVGEHFVDPQCSTQLSTKFQRFIKTKIQKNKTFLAFKLSNVVFIMLINVKMPTIVGILTVMRMIKLLAS